MRTRSSSVSRYQSSCQQLARRYEWRLLDLQTWSARAAQSNPAATDEQKIRHASLRVYAQSLHRACLDPALREQAYGELYNYLLARAYWRDPDLASDAAQEAIILVQRSFADADLTPCRKPSGFLYFADMKVKDALKMLRRRYRVKEEVPESDLTGSEDESSPISRTPDSENPPLGQILEGEEEQWRQETMRSIALEVLDCLDNMWGSKRLHSQLTAVIVTYIDRRDDEEIAQQLETTPKNVEVLRSRGLDNVRKRLRDSLEIE